jgi:hypothetical protein
MGHGPYLESGANIDKSDLDSQPASFSRVDTDNYEIRNRSDWFADRPRGSGSCGSIIYIYDVGPRYSLFDRIGRGADSVTFTRDWR